MPLNIAIEYWPWTILNYKIVLTEERKCYFGLIYFDIGLERCNAPLPLTFQVQLIVQSGKIISRSNRTLLAPSPWKICAR